VPRIAGDTDACSMWTGACVGGLKTGVDNGHSRVDGRLWGGVSPPHEGLSTGKGKLYAIPASQDTVQLCEVHCLKVEIPHAHLLLTLRARCYQLSLVFVFSVDFNFSLLFYSLQVDFDYRKREITRNSSKAVDGHFGI